MKIKDADTENMTNDEINSLIKKLYQSKSQTSRGGGGHSKVNIRTLSNADIAFDKNAEYYECLKIPLNDNFRDSEDLFFQKNTTNWFEAIRWLGYRSYDESINYALSNKHNSPKSSKEYDSYRFFNIFILNYDEQ